MSENNTSSSTVDPLGLLSEELKSDDTETRINAVSKIKVIATALGQERTRLELIPYITDACVEDEDEVLVTLASELGSSFVPLVGGPIFASCLLAPLESLAAVEETVVRTKACEAINTVIPHIQDDELLLPLIKRLSTGDWFTSRVSAASLFASAYEKAGSNNSTQSQESLREMFTILTNDDTPMVRRATASQIGKFASVLTPSSLVSEFLLPIFKKLITDDQDSVRLLCYEHCDIMMKSCASSTSTILPLIKSAMEDRSWRVRFVIAKNFASIATAVGSSDTLEHLIEPYVILCQDSEAEVRAVAVKEISVVADVIGVKAFLNTSLIDTISQLSNDPASSVRSALSITLMELSPKLGQGVTAETFVPLFTKFLKDEVVDVRLNVLRRIHVIAEWMGMESSLIPVIQDLSRDLSWRVRTAVLSTLPSLAGTTGPAFFNTSFLSIIQTSMSDMVSSVREAAAESFSGIIKSLGADWAVDNLLPILNSLFDSSTLYQERVNVLRGVKNIALSTLSLSVMEERLVSLALKGAKDKVPNVRAEAVLALSALLKKNSDNVITPALIELSKSDGDSDVKYNALCACHENSITA